MRVLAGDIGGTKTLLQVSAWAAGRPRTIREQRFDSCDYPSFDNLLIEFLNRGKKENIDSVCFGVAGPVRETDTGQTVKVTNLPWEIESDAIARDFGFPRVRLINDFQAIGYGIELLKEGDLVVLQQGEPLAHGPRGVIGAGTGLGQALLVWQADHYEPIATEGGHANFGPTSDLQIELLRYLLKTAGRSSYELIISGHGLARLYAFLKERGGIPESSVMSKAMKTGDAAIITRAALEQNDRLANQAMDLFVEIYGAQAGNLALTAGATGGVYIAGGIAPKIVSRLTDGRFLRAFRNKGKMSAYVESIPVSVVMNPEVGLIGAARLASRLN
ncbi:MAG: glucokinase [Sulfuricaulis sp.]|uniref:glucokinase n=1 Tax=Sulfuricaulis sp. TaxID=2003553 RepID=UPI0034A553EE